MLMHADAYFAIGKAHTVCQDYAEVTTGTSDDLLAAVSDGCSSSPHTDFGARCLVRASMEHHHDTRDLGIELPAWFILTSALSATLPLRLPPESLDATLLLAQVRNGRLRVIAFGDGLVVLALKDGSQQTWSISFAKEAPAYLNYLSNTARLKNYLKDHGLRRIDHVVRRRLTTQTELSALFTTNSATVEQIEFPKGEGLFEQASAFGAILCDVEAAQVRSAWLCSDGVRSFRRLVSPGVFEPVPPGEVLEQITAIRSPVGEFMVRRMRRFLQDFCPKHGWVHDDDVAVAAILSDEV